MTKQGSSSNIEIRYMLLPELKELEDQLADKDAEIARLRQELEAIKAANV